MTVKEANDIYDATDGYCDIDDGYHILLDGHFTVEELEALILLKKARMGSL